MSSELRQTVFFGWQLKPAVFPLCHESATVLQADVFMPLSAGWNLYRDVSGGWQEPTVRSRKNKNCALHESFDEDSPLSLPVFVVCRDVLPQNFDSYSSEVQKLICTADHLGALMQYDTPGFLPNRRIHRGTTDECCSSYGQFKILIIAAQIHVVCTFSSHGFSNPGGDAGNASDMEQL